MTLHDSFLRDILMSPHDDVVRLIYADWLEEQDDPASADRSAFIRVQIQLAGMTGGEPDYEETRQREQLLLRRWEQEWLGPVRPLLKGWTFRRGFVEEVTLTAPRFLAHAEVLLSREPVCRVRFLQAASHIGALAGCPLLARLYSLDFSYSYLNDAAVQLLAASPYLAGLEELILDHNFIRSAGGEALTRASQLFNLALLDLRSNHIASAARETLRERFGAAVRF
jgi:uncharacterized protein (TIGR02996 family)